MTRDHFCGFKGPRTIFIVQATRAYDIHKFSYFQGTDSEHEVLFRPFSKFKVVNALKSIIDAKELHIYRIRPCSIAPPSSVTTSPASSVSTSPPSSISTSRASARALITAVPSAAKATSQQAKHAVAAAGWCAKEAPGYRAAVKLQRQPTLGWRQTNSKKQHTQTQAVAAALSAPAAAASAAAASAAAEALTPADCRLSTAAASAALKLRLHASLLLRLQKAAAAAPAESNDCCAEAATACASCDCEKQTARHVLGGSQQPHRGRQQSLHTLLP